MTRAARLYFWVPVIAWLVWLYRSNVSVQYNIPEFDVERSIELHNRIVQIGLDSVPEDVRALVRTQVDWFAAHNITNVKELRLTPQLVTFLSNITIVLDSSQLSFLPHLQGVADPIWLRDESVVRLKDRFNRYEPSLKPSKGLFMYPTEDDSVLIYKHPDPDSYGIAMDLKTHLCAFAQQERPLYHGSGEKPTDRAAGQSLQDILGEYLRRIKHGKLFVDSVEAEKRILEGGDPTGSNGWHTASWTKRDLQLAIDAWGALVGVIEGKSSVSSSLDRHGGEPGQVVNLIDAIAAGSLDGSPPFAREFLMQARRPSFTFIAPGLRIPNASFYVSAHARSRDRFEAVADQMMATFGHWPYSSIPLFPADKPGVKFYDESEENVWRRFGWLDNEAAGLYLQDEEEEGSGSLLLLPFELPVDAGKARGLGSKKDKSNVAMYQQQHCGHGLPRQAAPLSEVLSHWVSMIQRGEWTVGKDGVEGGIEQWKDAEKSRKDHMYASNSSCRY